MDLPRENVFGHTKKVRLLCDAIAQIRAQRGCVSVLDLGCGNGSAVTQYLGNVADRVLGIDLHRPSIAYARSNFGREGLTFECGDATDLVAGQSFHVAVLADILEHVSPADVLLRLAADSVEPGGTVLVTVPNGRGPFELESSFSRRRLGRLAYRVADLFTALLNKTVFRDAWTSCVAPMSGIPYNIENRHINFFSLPDIVTLADRVGLRLVRRVNLSWFSGPYTNTFFAPSRLFCRLNCSVAEKLPADWVSAWFLEFRKP